MTLRRALLPLIAVLLLAAVLAPAGDARDIVRPEEIKSKRQVVYDDATYSRLAQLWREYYNEYPSEYAYANWMYAARYAGDKEYNKLLDKGIGEYPANPTLLYLKGLQYCREVVDPEGRRLLERAIALDPSYSDPWFVLVTEHMVGRDDEALDLALRRLLESGVITDEIMDYNYNVLTGLEENAILITNGDNDTYPAWILTRLLGVRPDVAIVNRSLLNTDWYALYVIEQGVPRFISKSELQALRQALKQPDADNLTYSGLYGDTLINLIVKSAERASRPVYLAKTMYTTEGIKGLIDGGRDLGLATLVTTSGMTYGDQLLDVYQKWLSDFRTAGLDSWRLKASPAADAGRMIVPNYAAALAASLVSLKQHAPQLRSGLFAWYRDHVELLMPEELRYRFGQAWCCAANDLTEVENWCRQQGIVCKESDKK